jgi:hypothetical protein
MKLLKAACGVGLFAGIGIAVIATSTACSNTGQVRAVFMALDSSGDRVRDTFFTDTTTIFCDISWVGRGNDNTVGVVWMQTSGEQSIFDGTDTRVPVSRIWGGIDQGAPEGETIISFTMNPPQAGDGGTTLPFPVGVWQCVVNVNGEVASTKEFNILYPTPDCPADNAASNGMPCAGYTLAASCRSDDNPDPHACSCPGTPDPIARTWACN